MTTTTSSYKEAVRVLPVNRDSVKEAGRILRAGGLVVAPTHTNYNLLCNPMDKEAIGRVFAVKQRRKEFGPLPATIAYRGQAEALVSVPEWFDRRLLRRFWPGGVTFVFPLHYPFPPELTCGVKSLALGCTPHPAFAAVIRAAGGVLAATSANLSGQGDIFVSLDKAARDLGGSVDLYLDGGPAWGEYVNSPHRSATIVDATTKPPRLLRRGIISEEVLRDEMPGLLPLGGPDA